MAHSYSNFADAFAALSACNTDYRKYIGDCYDECDKADDNANEGEFKWGIRYCVYAIKALQTAIDQIIDGQYFDPDVSAFFESIYWASQEGGNGVDMDAILTAMISADRDEFIKFIGISDGYRVGMVGKPWNKDFYAALGRGFSEK